MAGRFCPGCGAPRKEEARFCGGCGRSFDEGQPGQAPPPVSPPSRPTAGAASPSSATATANGAGAAPFPSGWQVVVGDTLPAFPPVPAGAVKKGGGKRGPPGKERDEGSQEEKESLRGPGFYVLFTVANDLLCTLATGNPAATGTAFFRGGAGAATFLMGTLAGRRRGIFSFLMMVSAIGLALAQGGSLIDLIKEALQDPQLLGPALQQLPALLGGGISPELPSALKGSWLNIFTQGLSLLAAVGAIRRTQQ